MKNVLMRLWKEEEGQDLAEYGLLLAFIVLLSVVLVKSLGNIISAFFSNAAACLT